ncbi:MAG: pilus assembly protein CpaB [Thermoleophilaceae bacterium]|nr:pilus assembly protein CpaB [Thermoleophilaceae bacterium]
MKGRSPRRRGALMLCLALACGGLAASEVQDRTRRVEAQVGPLVPVVVARRDLAADEPLAAAKLPALLERRQVPARFAPPDALAAPEEAAGARLSAPLAAGGYLTAGQLGASGRDDRGDSPSRGERAVDVAVAGGESLPDAPAGTRVDVLVTSESRSGAGRTTLALEDVELLSARPAAEQGGDGAAAHAATVATLRVTLRQAVYLTAAQSFAREVRLLARAPGDRRAAGALTVPAGGL